MNTMSFAQAQASSSGGLMSTVVMFAVMFAVLYFILIRPQQKQQKKHQSLLDSLKKGDEVILASGIMGKVSLVEDKIVFIEIGEKTRLKVLKQAVQGIVSSTENTSIEKTN